MTKVPRSLKQPGREMLHDLTIIDIHFCSIKVRHTLLSCDSVRQSSYNPRDSAATDGKMYEGLMLGYTKHIYIYIYVYI